MKVIVHREEIYVRIQNENRKASKAVKGDIMGIMKKIKKRFSGVPDRSPTGNVHFKDGRPHNHDKDVSGTDSV